MDIYQNSFISSPYLCLGVEELTNKLKPNYIFFNIRNPIQSVESFYKKGWYLNVDNKNKTKSPLIDISESQYRSFSRIIPNDEFLEKWITLSRIGKITWFWSTMNKLIYDDFNKMQNIDKFFIKLEDINQNFNFYTKLSEKFNFENRMNKTQFYNVLNKTPNNDTYIDYSYKDWNELEKKEFENIINDIFPHYDTIKTSL